MKAILKATVAAALAGVLVNTLLKRAGASRHGMGGQRRMDRPTDRPTDRPRMDNDVPTLNEARDAEPQFAGSQNGGGAAQKAPF